MDKKNMVNDDSQPKDWPERIITKITPLESNELDEFDNAARVDLDCGHYFVRTFTDPRYMPYKVSDKVGCRTCYIDGPDTYKIPEEVVH